MIGFGQSYGRKNLLKQCHVFSTTLKNRCYLRSKKACGSPNGALFANVPATLIETLDRVPEWVKANRIIVSGFHSPLEQQVLRSVLRRNGRVVKVLARGMSDYRPAPDEREPLVTGQMLVLSACSPEVQRTTRQTALARNRLVLALAAETVIPFVAGGSPLAALIEVHRHG